MPDQSADGERYERSLCGIEHAQPGRVPRLGDSAENKDDRGGNSCSGEGGVQRGEIGEQAGQKKQRDARSDRTFAQGWKHQRRGDSSGRGADGAVERRFPRRSEIGLRDNQRGKDGPVALW